MTPRSVLLQLLLAAFLLPAVAHAQHWTPEEQEIIDLNQHCWDAWAAEDLEQVSAICNEHPDGRGWLLQNGSPDAGWVYKNLERYSKAFYPITEWVYHEIKPLSVRIFNDTALIHFVATRTMRDDKNNLTTDLSRQLNIWQKQDGRWTWIGGMADRQEQ